MRAARLSPIIGYFACSKYPPKSAGIFRNFCFTCVSRSRTCGFTNITMAEIMISIFNEEYIVEEKTYFNDVQSVNNF